MRIQFNQEKYNYLKNSHYQILEYLLKWIFGKKPPKSIDAENKTYYWFSLQKIADDLYKSYYQVKTALYRLENKDKSIYYGNNEPLVYSKMIHSRTETNKIYLSLNYAKIMEILIDNPNNHKLVYEIMNKEADMPALFEFEKKNYSKDAEKIVMNILNKNQDIFKTKISKTKTYDRCCKIIQDIFDGNFTNPHIYNISKNMRTSQFDFDGWKNKINSIKNDWVQIQAIMDKAISNYRMMFDKQNMPSNKNYLPDKLDKWLYDELNDKGYPSYFVLSLKKPKSQKMQYSDNEAEKIFESLPTKIQDVGNNIIDYGNILNDYVLWKNLKGMFDWCNLLFDSNINQNVGYWVNSPAEIITKFVDYCNSRCVLMNERTFDVNYSLNHSTPFAWFITDAINTHKLNQKILKFCA